MKLENIKELERQYVLLDTNVLIDSTKYPEEFDSFFGLLKKFHVESVIDYVVKFEFLKGARNKDEYKKHIKFLDLLCGTDRHELFLNKEIFEVAENISRIAYKSSNKNLSLNDSLIAAQIQKYSKTNSNRLFLATQNHKDFLPTLFEQIYIHTFTLKDGVIKNICIYTFRENIYKELTKKLKY